MNTVIIKLTLILSALLYTQLSHAGGVGNGGFILKCYQDQQNKPFRINHFLEGDLDLKVQLKELKTSFSTYDLWEGEKSKAKLNPDLGNIEGKNYKQIAEFVLNRLSSLNPSRAARYLKKLNAFEADIEDLDDDEDFVVTSDLGAAKKPSNCLVKQVMQQRPDQQRRNGEEKYLRKKSLWNKLPEDVKASIAIHEIIYDEMILFGHINSNSTRYFNSLISSSQFLKLSQFEYIKVVIKVFPGSSTLKPTFDYKGLSLATSYNIGIDNGIIAQIIQHVPGTWMQDRHSKEVFESIKPALTLPREYDEGMYKQLLKTDLGLFRPADILIDSIGNIRRASGSFLFPTQVNKIGLNSTTIYLDDKSKVTTVVEDSLNYQDFIKSYAFMPPCQDTYTRESGEGKVTVVTQAKKPNNIYAIFNFIFGSCKMRFGRLEIDKANLVKIEVLEGVSQKDKKIKLITYNNKVKVNNIFDLFEESLSSTDNIKLSEKIKSVAQCHLLDQDFNEIKNEPCTIE